MCTGAEGALLAAATSAVGTGVSMNAQDQARREQDQAAAQGIMRQAELQRQADSQVGQTVQQIATSNPEQDKQVAERDYLQALQRNKSATTGALNPVAGASSRYAEDVNNAATSGAADAAGLVKTQAAIDAPGLQRTREATAQGDLVSRLGLLGGQSSGQAGLTNMQVGSIAANPWATALGSGLSAAGGAMAGRQYGKNKTAGSSSAWTGL